MKSYVVLDHSGSMFGCWHNAKIIAHAILSNATYNNPLGFITFDEQVHVHNYFTPTAGPLLAKLGHLPLPNGVTELVDALMTAVVIDNEKPQIVFLISDLGENASEISQRAFDLLNSFNINYIWIKPPRDLNVVVPPWVVARDLKPVKVIEEIKNVQRIDLTPYTEPAKLYAALDEIRLGRFERLLGTMTTRGGRELRM